MTVTKVTLVTKNQATILLSPMSPMSLSPVERQGGDRVNNKFQRYEDEKKRLARMGLPPDEYQQRIKRLAEKLRL